MRYERKYRIEAASFGEVKEVLRQNTASFQIAYADRYVNSIYLDSLHFSALEENLAGISNRTKYRIRWYGKDFTKAHKPRLEKKIKANQLGTKEISKLPSFELSPNFDILSFLSPQIPEIQELRPVVIIRYLRTYLVSSDQQVRATIDRQLSYYLYQGRMLFAAAPMRDEAIILEIKYDKELEDHVQPILQQIPFRLTKNSKYVSGIVANYY